LKHELWRRVGKRDRIFTDEGRLLIIVSSKQAIKKCRCYREKQRQMNLSWQTPTNESNARPALLLLREQYG